MRNNPVSGDHCTNLSKSDSDIDNDLILGRRLQTDQPLSPALIEYVKNEYVLWVQPKDYDKPLLDYYSIGTNHIISKQFRNVLESHEVKAEYVPIRILDDTNNSTGEYFLAHYLSLIACNDSDRSTDTKRPYGPGYNVVALREELIPENTMLFREKERFRSSVFVHKQLKDAITAEGIKGLLFFSLPVDGWEIGQLIGKLESECAE